MTNPPNVRDSGAATVRATGQAPTDPPPGRRPTFDPSAPFRSPARATAGHRAPGSTSPARALASGEPATPSSKSDEQALTCQLALAKGNPHADAPDAGDFLRRRAEALRRDQPDKAEVFQLCAERQFRLQQAEMRAVTIAPLEHGPDLGPVA